MSLYKRNDVWWVNISHNGTRIRQSTGTPNKVAAKRFHDQLKAGLWDEKYLEKKPSYTWIEAVVRWLSESQHKRSLNDDKGHLKWLDPFLRNLKLSQITRSVLDNITNLKLKEGVKPSSVNRMLEVIRVILRKAHHEWEWVDRIPSIRMLKEDNRRIRWITKEQANRLLIELPEHLASMAAFALATGLRKANITGLQWSQVNLVNQHAWIHPDQAKAGKAIPVPLNTEAVRILRKQMGNHSCYVFTYKGKPIAECNTKAWKKALKKAGIKDFRWHDLRHTWASWHVQNGTSLQELQLLGGWASLEMVLRYAHLSSDHLKEAAERISVTKLSQCHLKVVGDQR